MEPCTDKREKEGIPVEDLQFLMETQLLRATPDQFKRLLISSMTKSRVSAGDRFISQGTPGDRIYLIQEGSCVVSLEKNGQSHPISRLKAGDVVGEVAILTGENRTANVDAETDITLWSLQLERFEEISGACPEVREFLTEIATERLCSQKIMAERSIGKYIINEAVAEGGWSIVYKGFHSLLKLPVAVKMLKHNMAMDTAALKRFQGEAVTIASLNHENIVRVYDIENIYRTVFIVMEFLEGLTLKHVLQQKFRLSLDRILEILLQVCSALDYAHKKGIVHQDVKPGNVFIQRDGRVKIVDFGLACPIGWCSDELPGTAFYMAPEQIEGDPVDPRTDIYSLGITAYEMATGRRPFPDDVCEVFRAHITEPTPDPRALNPYLPEEFSRFIARATQKDPEARYQDIGEVIEALSSMAAKIGAEPRARSDGKRRMLTLFMFYEDERHLELNQLLDGFSEQLQDVGAELRVVDFENL